MKQSRLWLIVALVTAALAVPATAGDKTIAGVAFPGEKMVAGKKLVLNGTGLRKKFGFIKVFAGGFYLEKATSSAAEAMNSEQVKQFYLHYLTSKATAEKLQHGFIEAIEAVNSPEQVKAQEANIKRYASWLDRDMAPGKTSVTTYVPGKGLTLVFYGEEKGTINDPDFIALYMNYVFGEKANAALRDGYLGK